MPDDIFSPIIGGGNQNVSPSSFETNLTMEQYNNTFDVNPVLELSDMLADVGITDVRGSDGALAMEQSKVAQEQGMTEAAAAIMYTREHLMKVELAGIDYATLGGAITPDIESNWLSVLSDGANGLDSKAAQGIIDNVKMMPVKDGTAAINKLLFAYGNRPKDTMDPRTWSAGTWMSAAALMITWMQNEENRKENQRRYEASEARADREYALRARQIEGNLALGEAALAAKPKPGAGARIGRSSIYQ